LRVAPSHLVAGPSVGRAIPASLQTIPHPFICVKCTPQVKLIENDCIKNKRVQKDQFQPNDATRNRFWVLDQEEMRLSSMSLGRKWKPFNIRNVQLPKQLLMYDSLTCWICMAWDQILVGRCMAVDREFACFLFMCIYFVTCWSHLIVFRAPFVLLGATLGFLLGALGAPWAPKGPSDSVRPFGAPWAPKGSLGGPIPSKWLSSSAPAHIKMTSRNSAAAAAAGGQDDVSLEQTPSNKLAGFTNAQYKLCKSSTSR